MPAVVRSSCLALAILAPWIASAGQPSATPVCTEWRDCRTRVLEAIERGEFEAAHDLAWRAVQTGPRDDADLMYLLARAQALGGRPQDALVMLRRLAERGIVLDAATHPDFLRTRELAGWSDVAVLIERAGADGGPASGAPPPKAAEPPKPTPVSSDTRAAARPESPAARPASPAPAAAEPAGKGVAPAAVATTMTPRHVEIDEAARFSSDRFVAGGLAYDGVSQRFLFGDSSGRKVRVVAEGLARATDLVGASSAGFFTVVGVEIDARRGDLWVATAETSTGDAALHKLQLVSGRLLAIFPAAASLTPLRPVDLAVSPGGAVFAVDALGGRLLRVRPGGTALESVMPLKVEGATSVAIGSSGSVLYVAHRDGISRVDVNARRVAAVGAPKDVALAGFEWLRPRREGLVGVQTEPDGSRRIVLLELNARGRAVTGATRLDADIPARGSVAVAVVGDDLCVFESLPPEDASTGVVERVVRRIRLQ